VCSTAYKKWHATVCGPKALGGQENFSEVREIPGAAAAEFFILSPRIDYSRSALATRKRLSFQR